MNSAPAPLATGQLLVERVDDPTALPPLASAWDELASEDHPGAVFRSAAWLLPWWKHFGGGKELSVYVARVGRRLVGVLPAYRVRAPLGGTRLRLLGDGLIGSDYLGVIARPGDLHAASLAIGRMLTSDEHDLVLDGLADDDPLLDALAAAPSAAALTVEPLLPCPLLRLAGERDFHRWLAGLPDGAGAQLLRRRRWLARRSGFRVEVVSDPAAIAEALATLWRLHRARWERAGGSDADGGTATLRFHGEAARALARRGRARVYLLHADGAPRAALYGFRAGRRFSFYQSGSDPSWRARSVGTVMLGAAIEDAFADGLDEFDFLRGDESYKARYANARRGLVRARLAAGPRARAIHLVGDAVRSARQLVREALPPAAVDWIRRARRRALSLGAATLSAETEPC